MNRLTGSNGRFFSKRARSARRAAALLVLLSAMPTMAADDGPLTVAVVNYPLAYFAERIGGDSVTVRFLAPPDADPAFWKPDADAVQAYQTADLILLNGAGYAKWIANATLPRRKLVDTSHEIREALLPGSNTVIHSHGPEGDHSHSGVAFTTWLDPRQAMTQAHAVQAALARLRPGNAEKFRLRAEELAADLAALDEDLAATLAAFADMPLLASHPVYQYLARRYGLDVRALLWEPDVMPGDDDWATLDNLLAERAAGWMLWEGQPLPETRDRLAGRGIGIIVFEPGGNRPAAGDYLSLMAKNVDAVREAAEQMR